MANAEEESRIEHLDRHLRWEPNFASRVVRQAERRGLLLAESGHLRLTDDGRALAREAIVR